jgi:hypothetical protein
MMSCTTYREVAIFLVSMTTNAIRMRNLVVDQANPFASTQGISESERRAAYPISKISEMFPESSVLPKEMTED